MSMSGKQFKARVGSGPTTISGIVRGSIVEDDGAELDATDAEAGGGFAVNEIGVKQLTARLTVLHDSTGTPLPTLIQGTSLTLVKLYPHGLSGGYWSMPVALVTGCGSEIEVRGRCECPITIKSQGTYSWVAPE